MLAVALAAYEFHFRALKIIQNKDAVEMQD